MSKINDYKAAKARETQYKKFIENAVGNPTCDKFGVDISLKSWYGHYGTSSVSGWPSEIETRFNRKIQEDCKKILRTLQQDYEAETKKALKAAEQEAKEVLEELNGILE